MSDLELINFWAKRPSLYAGIRNTIYNTTGSSELVPALEHLILCSKENVVKDLAQNENKALLNFDKKRRLALGELVAPDLPANPGLHQAVYKKLAGDRREKNRERRRQRNLLRQKYAGQPDFETLNQQKERKLYNKLVTRNKFAKDASTPGTVVPKPLTVEPVASSSKLISFNSTVNSHDGVKFAGKKRFKKSTGKNSKKPSKGGDLRQKLINMRNMN
jgi:hypothetical protein